MKLCGKMCEFVFWGENYDRVCARAGGRSKRRHQSAQSRRLVAPGSGTTHATRRRVWQRPCALAGEEKKRRGEEDPRLRFGLVKAKRRGEEEKRRREDTGKGRPLPVERREEGCQCHSPEEERNEDPTRRVGVPKRRSGLEAPNPARGRGRGREDIEVGQGTDFDGTGRRQLDATCLKAADWWHPDQERPVPPAHEVACERSRLPLRGVVEGGDTDPGFEDSPGAQVARPFGAERQQERRREGEEKEKTLACASGSSRRTARFL